MPRNPGKIVEGRNNKLWMRIEVPEIFLAIAKQLSGVSDRKESEIITQIIYEVAASLRLGRGAFLGPELASVVPEVSKRLRLAKEMKESQNITVDGKLIDVGIIHANPKMKSGFAGVFGNGQGFRAMGKDPATGGAILIGYYSTALEAAWARCVHYQKHDLAYGPWGEAYEVRRIRHPHESIYDSKAECAYGIGRETKSSVGIPEEFMRFYNGEMPTFTGQSAIDPEPMDIASINERAAKRMREIAAEKKAKAEAEQAERKAKADEERAAKAAGASKEPVEPAELDELTEEAIMARAR